MVALSTSTALSQRAFLLDQKLEHFGLSSLAEQVYSPVVSPFEAPNTPLPLAALAGRITEITAWYAAARYTLTSQLVYQAQQQHEAVAWISGVQGFPYPPDLVHNNISLQHLCFVQTPQETAWQRCRAAEHLLRSGAFALVVIDLLPAPALPMQHMQLSYHERKLLSVRDSQLGRILKLAQDHHTAVVCLTQRPTPNTNKFIQNSSITNTLGSLVSLQLQCQRSLPQTTGPQRFASGLLHLQALKDKQQAPGWQRNYPLHEPLGMY